MHTRIAAALFAVASFALVAPQANAEGYGFINKYIEKYAKVKDGKIGDGRFDMNSRKYVGEGSSSATQTSQKKSSMTSLRTKKPKLTASSAKKPALRQVAGG